MKLHKIIDAVESMLNDTAEAGVPDRVEQVERVLCDLMHAAHERRVAVESHKAGITKRAETHEQRSNERLESAREECESVGPYPSYVGLPSNW